MNQVFLVEIPLANRYFTGIDFYTLIFDKFPSMIDIRNHIMAKHTLEPTESFWIRILSTLDFLDAHYKNRTDDFRYGVPVTIKLTEGIWTGKEIFIIKPYAVN